MNPVLQKILDTGTIISPAGKTIPLNSSIPENEGRFLQELIRRFRPTVTLEVGMAYGVSALYICEALRDVKGTKHFAIDPYQLGVDTMGFVSGPDHKMDVGFSGIGINNIREAGYGDLLEFINASSHQALPTLEAQGKRIDFAFIDGWHTFDYAFIDFFYVDRILRPGGIVVFDDLSYRAVRSVCRYIVSNRAYKVVGREEMAPETGRAAARRQIVKGVAAVANLPGISKIGRHVTLPDLKRSHDLLGLPTGNYVAFQKERDDVLGDGTSGSRRWDEHTDF